MLAGRTVEPLFACCVVWISRPKQGKFVVRLDDNRLENEPGIQAPRKTSKQRLQRLKPTEHEHL